MKISKRKLKALDFYFIEEVNDLNIYVKKYAKDLHDGESQVDILRDSVAFYDNTGYDSRRVIKFSDIVGIIE